MPGAPGPRIVAAMRHALILALTLAACTADGDYPRLLPTEQALAEPALPAHATAARTDPAPLEDATAARAAALQARADALRGPVVDPGLQGRAGG